MRLGVRLAIFLLVFGNACSQCEHKRAIFSAIIELNQGFVDRWE
jgi:hypothetical protein